MNACVDWGEERLISFKYDVGIYFADILDLENLTKENLQHALCYFIPEVTKVKGEGPYPGKTLYQLIVVLQKYLNINKLKWKLVEGSDFEEMRNVLDNVMQERTRMNLGIVKKQAMVISYDTEQELWEHGILGEDTPDRLRNTVLFLIGINVLLRAVDEHYSLHREINNERSQLSFERNDRGEKCLVYREDTVTKTHDGGLKDMRHDRKIVWVYPSEDVNRCPVRLVEKYLSLCPNYTKKSNFYLQSLQKPTPKQWYAGQVVGENSISKVVKSLMQEANIEGFFTNHSLRRSGGSHLFQAGVQQKLVKETTGHRSDVVDDYQITSDAQRQAISKIIANKTVNEVREVSHDVEIQRPIETEKAVDEKKVVACQCQNGKKIDQSNIAEIVSNIVDATSKKGKTVIKLNIEIHSE